MVTLPAAGYIENDARTQGEAKQFFEDVLAFITERFGLDSGILARSKNALINGNFDLWQRGTTVTTTTGGAYIADRWRHELVGASGSITVSRQAFTLGQTDVPGEPTYYYRANQTAAPATGTTAAEQRKESVRSFAGQKVTVSFYAKADAAQTFELELAQNFGTGGTPSSEVSLTQNLSLTTGWALYTATFDLASISGKTIGNNGDDYLGVRLNSTVGTNSTFTLDLSRVQLEPGDGATPFDQREPGEEYDLAARYYWQSMEFPGDFSSGGAPTYYTQNAGVNTNGVWVKFPVRMRDVPTIGFARPNASAGAGNWWNFARTADSGAAAAEHTDEGASFIGNPQVSADGVSERCAIHVVVDAEL